MEEGEEARVDELCGDDAGAADVAGVLDGSASGEDEGEEEAFVLLGEGAAELDAAAAEEEALSSLEEPPVLIKTAGPGVLNELKPSDQISGH